MQIFIENEKKEKDYIFQILKDKFNLTDVKILYTKNGKPYIENSDLFFNITHNDKYTVYVFDNKKIGVDIEKIRDYDLNMNKALKINANSNKEFFIEWTKREALIKYEGLTIKDIYNIDSNNYMFDIIEFDNNIISICRQKK